jgi:hypothetical protein
MAILNPAVLLQVGNIRFLHATRFYGFILKHTSCLHWVNPINDHLVLSPLLYCSI